MRKTSRIIWLALVTYTLLYLFFFGFQSPLLTQLINGEADMFSSSFFNVMGIVPIIFLMYAFLNQSKRKWQWLPYAFGFFAGAYSVLFGQVSQIQKQSSIRLIRTLLLVLSILGLTWFYINGWFFGRPSAYFELFFEDALVGIMTIDFLVLYAWSILLAKHHYQAWYWAWIPMIGFAGLMLIARVRIHPKDQLLNHQ
jgi:hypothetical protein